MHKSRPVQIKAAGVEDGLGEGQFKALVSVFNNIDSTGDMVMPGAFTKTLEEWSASGLSIPVYWSHRMDDPDMNIGDVLEAAETDTGLEVLGQLDVPDGSPKALQAYKLLKGRRTNQFSFAYDVLDGGPVEKDGQEYNELRELKLYEVSTTPIGANDQTELLAVKHLETYFKSGRVISAKNEATLRDALDALQASASQIKSVLAALDSGSSGDDGGKAASSAASGTGPAKDEEPSGAKSEEPIRRTSVATWETAITLSELEGAT